MSITRQSRQSGSATPGGLIERGWELDAVAEAIAAAGRGAGSTLMIEGPAGAGATALLGAATAVARAAGAEVLGATATELERDFPFGVAMQLLEPVWLGADPRDREALLLGSAAAAGALLAAHERLPGPADEVDYSLIHALHWFVRNLAAMRTGDQSQVLVARVDDAHWADEASARLIAYLARRCHELPLVLMLSARAGAEPARSGTLGALRHSPHTIRVSPLPLTAEGVAELCRRRLPTATNGFCEAVAAASAGNPALAVAILDEVRHQELSAAIELGVVSPVVPPSIVESVRRELEALSRTARLVAIGVAVLGDAASLPSVAAYGAISPGAVLAIVDELIDAGLLARGVPFAFAQPVRRSAALSSLGQAERGRGHARAARILADAGAPPAVVAEHLLATIPGSDPRIAEQLTSCAQAVLDAGDGALAATLFARALSEQPSDDQRAEILVGLHLAETEAGAPDAPERLAEAKQATDDPARYAEIVLLEAEGLYADGEFRAAAAALETGRRRLGGAETELAEHMADLYVVAAALVPELRDDALLHRTAMLARVAGAPNPAQRVALAHTALHDAIAGQPSAGVTARARLAWHGGALLDSVAPTDLTIPMLFGALVAADDLDAIDLLHIEGAEHADRHPWLAAALRPLRAWALVQRGRIAEAEAEARASAELDGPTWPASEAVALSVIASCHIHRDDLAPAEAAIRTLGDHVARHPPTAPAQLLLQAELRLAQHRPDESLADALEAGAAFERMFPGATPSVSRWRSAAAAAHLALGEPEQAVAVLEPELAAARDLRVLSTAIRALRLKGLAVGGEPGLGLLRDAVALGDATGPRLEHVRALVDLGAALRRANRRAAAREPLRRGLDLANHGGASALAAKAHTELVASGARPRRLAFSGIDSLTVSQRRVAELAARGLTTRQVAEALFVTPKTVEFHLRQAYLKLDISSRAELTERFDAASER